MSAYDVRGFGALGDGKSKDTSFLQKAIDEAAAAGGGTVFFPAGTYLTGTLYLDDHVHLELSPGAVILGSPDPEDYNRDDFCPQNECFASEHVSGAHLIAAVEKLDVGIHGGRIDGNRQAWTDEPNIHYPCKFKFAPWRPGQMLYFCQCRDVRIDGTELFHAPYWTCFLHGCDNVFVHGVRIWNDPRTCNGDGIDVDCCRMVTISDCQIDSGDDCITIRAHEKNLLGGRRVCEWVTVNNCILSTPTCNAFRIGVGNGEIRHCMVSNCMIHDTRTAICIIGKYAKTGPGAEISHVSFEHIQMDCRRPLVISANVRGTQDEPSRPMHDISFQHLRGKADHSCFITGNTDCNLSRITMSDVVFEYGGGLAIYQARKQKGSYGEFGIVTADAAFYMENVREVELDRVRIRWDRLNGPWKAAMRTVNVTGLTRRDCQFPKPPENTL